MEDTGYTYDQVHVLRQIFQPNEPFQAALNGLVTPTSSEAGNFSIYGSDERLIEIGEVSGKELAMEKYNADRYMETKRGTHLHLKGEVSARVLAVRNKGAIALQLVMKPADIVQYALVKRGLDIITLGRKSREIGFDASRLYTNIPFSHLRPIPEVKENLAKINEVLGDSATKQLYQLTPLPQLVGQLVPRAGREEKEATYPENSSP